MLEADTRTTIKKPDKKKKKRSKHRQTELTEHKGKENEKQTGKLKQPQQQNRKKEL